MMNPFTCSRAFVFTIILILCGKTLFAADTAYHGLFQPFTQVDTTACLPDYPILKPLPDGPLKILFIGRRDRVGVVASEAAARLDCRIESVLTFGYDITGNDTETFSSDDIMSSEAVTARLETLLQDDWDAVWCDFFFDAFPEGVKKALLERVELGAGLVYIGSQENFKSDIPGRQSDEALDESGYSGIGEIEGVAYGNGRVLFFPSMKNDISSRKAGNYFNAASYILYRSAVEESDAVISSIAIPHNKIEHEVVPISKYRVHLVNPGDPDSMTVYGRFRGENGRYSYEKESSFYVDSGRSFVLMDYPPLTIGTYSLDISLVQDGTVRSYSGTEFQVETADYISDVNLWENFVPENGFVFGTVRFSFVLPEGIYVTATVFDSRNDVVDYFDIDLVPGRKSADFSYKIKPGSDRALTFEFHIFKNNELVQRYEVPVLVERKPGPQSFSLAVIDNPSETELYPFERFNRYRTLVSGGVDVIAPCLDHHAAPVDAFNLIRDTALTGPAVLPVLSVDTASIPDTEHTASLVDTLRHSPIHSFGVVNSAGSVNCPDNTFMENINTVCRLIDALKSDKKCTVVGVPPSPFCGSMQSVIRDREQIGEANIVPFLTGENRCRDRISAALLHSTADSTGTPGVFIHGFPDWIGRVDEFAIVPWQAVFSGVKRLWWYPMEGDESAAFAPQGTMSPAFTALADETNIIRRGLDRLIYGCDRTAEKIAILFDDKPSVDTGDEIQSIGSLLSVCSDLGHAVMLLPLSACHTAEHSCPSIKTIIIPDGITLSSEVLGFINSFLQNGGTVIADTYPAAKETARQSAIESLFGISRPEQQGEAPDSSNAVQIEVSDFPKKSNDQVITGLQIAEPISINGNGRIIASIGGMPAVTLHQVSAGHAILFNIRQDMYEMVRFGSRGEFSRDLLSWCFMQGGIEKPEVTANAGENGGAGIESYIFSDGTGFYIGLVRTSAPIGLNADDERLIRLNVDLPGKTRFAYDAREGIYLGARESLPLNLPGGQATVVSLLPYRVRGIDVTLENSVVDPGGKLNINAELILHDRHTKAGRHVFRFQILDPDGKTVFHREQIEETMNGIVNTSLLTPVMEMSGQWYVIVQDVATGIKTEKTFLLKKKRDMKIYE